MTYAKSTETRARILEQSLDLFAKNGFEQTTLRKLAEDCGLSLGAFYYYFRSKEAIVAEYFAQSSQHFKDSLASILSRPSSSLGDDWSELCKLRFQEFKKHRELLQLLSRYAFDKAHPASPFHAKFSEIRKDSIEGFHRLLIKHGIQLVPKQQVAFSSLLWLSHLAVLLFWSWDKSPSQKKTKSLCSVSSETINVVFAFLPAASLFVDPILEKWSEWFQEGKRK